MRKCIYIFMMGFVIVASALSASLYKVEIVYLKNMDDENIRSVLIEDGVLDSGIEFVNEYFSLEQSITVTVGAEDGPLYDPAISEVQIPYAFYTEVVTRFSAIEEDQNEQAILASDAMLHTHVS